MILQTMIFPGQISEQKKELYIRSQGLYEKEPDGIRLAKGSCVQTDTYFNGFFPEEWKRYTIVSNVQLTLEWKGKGCIEIFEIQAEFGKLNEKILFSIKKDTKKQEELIVPFYLEKLTGIVGVRIFAEEESFIYHVKWECVETRMRKIQIALVTCTYQKEKYIERNLLYLRNQILENPKSSLYKNLQVYVIDNGRTLSADKFFDMKVIPNENTGGSGGFSRGMKEVMCEGKCTHILLMDDDVTVESAALEKTYSVLYYLKSEYEHQFLGGAMLRQDFPYIQHEAGGVWSEGQLESVGQGYDLRKQENLLLNVEEKKKVNYAAWWYCCIPVSYVEKHGYPLPFFLHFDDIEYSLREKQTPIYLNGIGIWHEQFEQKRNSSLVYYDMRNTLFTYQLHGIGKKKQIRKLIAYEIYSAISRYRYKDVELVFQAVEDYQKGIDWLKVQNPEELHQKINEMGYHWKEQKKVQGLVEKENSEEKLYLVENDSKKRIWRLLTINGSLFPVKGKEEIELPLGATLDQYYRQRRIYLYQPESGKGEWVEKDWKKIGDAVWRFLKIAFTIS